MIQLISDNFSAFKVFLKFLTTVQGANKNVANGRRIIIYVRINRENHKINHVSACI